MNYQNLVEEGRLQCQGQESEVEDASVEQLAIRLCQVGGQLVQEGELVQEKEWLPGLEWLQKRVGCRLEEEFEDESVGLAIHQYLEQQHNAFEPQDGEYDWEIYWGVEPSGMIGLQVKEDADHHLVWISLVGTLSR
jgi:hypothetical protein